MVRSARVAPWLFLVFSLAMCAALDRPASGGKARRRSAAGCVRYGQKMEKGNASVALRLRNGCRSAVSCSLEWKVSCDGGPAGGAEKATMDLARGEGREVSASAAACEAGWEVTEVSWTCEPVGDQ